VTTECVGINRGDGNKKSQRYGANRDAADELLGKTKLPAEQAINGRAGKR
jgi:hypothetical protein